MDLGFPARKPFRAGSSQVYDQINHPNFNFITHSPKIGESTPEGIGGGPGNEFIPQQVRVEVFGAAPQGHHQVGFLGHPPGELAGLLSGDIHSFFLHHLDYLRGDKSGGVGSRAGDPHYFFPQLPGEAFRHLAPAGVTHTDKEDALHMVKYILMMRRPQELRNPNFNKHQAPNPK